MRALFVMLDPIARDLSASTYWVDYVAVNRTCPVDNISRIFGLMPARFAYRLNYLERQPWYTGIAKRIQENLRITR
jgi:hypothetical protein